jgi:hypothetical protein
MPSALRNCTSVVGGFEAIGRIIHHCVLLIRNGYFVRPFALRDFACVNRQLKGEGHIIRHRLTCRVAVRASIARLIER